ncbi:MAG TPA: hypothetical protein VLA83_07665, partial [Candidatus Binatia bacterium]|nr:hypothetical protein [Candidatus Binatia bacterium]
CGTLPQLQYQRSNSDYWRSFCAADRRAEQRKQQLLLFTQTASAGRSGQVLKRLASTARQLRLPRFYFGSTLMRVVNFQRNLRLLHCAEIARDVMGYNHREIFALQQRALFGAIVLTEAL